MKLLEKFSQWFKQRKNRSKKPQPWMVHWSPRKPHAQASVVMAQFGQKRYGPKRLTPANIRAIERLEVLRAAHARMDHTWPPTRQQNRALTRKVTKQHRITPAEFGRRAMELAKRQKKVANNVK